jgi:hypothetical protein
MAILTQNPPTAKTSNPLRRSLEIVRADLAAYLWLNGLYYGLVILGMVYVMFFNPALQQQLLAAIGQAFTTGLLGAVGDAYGGGQVFTAMLLTFLVNLILGSFIEINLLGLIVPFSGLLMGLNRGLLWGLLLAPSEPSLAGVMVPHSLTLLIEGQAYVLAMLAVYVQGKAFLRPQAYGLTGHARGYVEGLRRTGWIYLLVTLLLAVAAVYEALEVIFLAPLFA